MTKTWHRGLPTALALVMALSLSPLHARAADGDGGGSDGFDWDRFWDYTACAASITFAAQPTGPVLIGIACGRVITKYWT